MMDMDRGFSLVELIVAMALTLLVMSAAFSLAAPGTATGRTEPESVDVQQRARVGADSLIRDLQMAGAGVHLGPATGPLRSFFAPILPRRAGLQNPDPFSAARPDAITIMYVADTLAQSVLRAPLPSAGASLLVHPLPNCAAGGALCRLAQGSSLVVFDTVGHFDFFTLLQVQVDSGQLRSWQKAHSSFSYPAGAVVAEAVWHTYYLDAQNRQLRHFDGYLTDIPVVDNVVDLAFDYFGNPVPPGAPRPVLGEANCLFDAAGAPQPGLALLAAQGGSLAHLPLSMFTDGPWCGDGENKFDADLFRIRSVRVTLRVQAANDMLRGQSADFGVAGKSLSAARRVPDYTLRFDVAPRNMGWHR